jgi:hypothetical protein
MHLLQLGPFGQWVCVLVTVVLVIIGQKPRTGRR